jgi:hypothetical protein
MFHALYLSSSSLGFLKEDYFKFFLNTTLPSQLTECTHATSDVSVSETFDRCAGEYLNTYKENQ